MNVSCASGFYREIRTMASNGGEDGREACHRLDLASCLLKGLDAHVDEFSLTLSLFIERCYLGHNSCRDARAISDGIICFCRTSDAILGQVADVTNGLTFELSPIREKFRTLFELARKARELSNICRRREEEGHICV